MTGDKPGGGSRISEQVRTCRPSSFVSAGECRSYHFWKQLLFEVRTDIVSCRAICTRRRFSPNETELEFQSDRAYRPVKQRNTGAPDTIRTCDLCLRRAAVMLGDIELRIDSVRSSTPTSQLATRNSRGSASPSVPKTRPRYSSHASLSQALAAVCRADSAATCPATASAARIVAAVSLT
jgi:hypothetical protein